jgi:hypothetical protein
MKGLKYYRMIPVLIGLSTAGNDQKRKMKSQVTANEQEIMKRVRGMGSFYFIFRRCLLQID